MDERAPGATEAAPIELVADLGLACQFVFARIVAMLEARRLLRGDDLADEFERIGECFSVDPAMSDRPAVAAFFNGLAKTLRADRCDADPPCSSLPPAKLRAIDGGRARGTPPDAA